LYKEGYVQRVARQKPPLTEWQRAARLRWAQEHVNWTWEQWATVLWSDESWVNPGRHRKVWVTRKRGPSEVFHPDCVELRWQRRIGWMIWGCISGLYGKGFYIFWEKSTGSISKETYSEHVVPLVGAYLQLHPGLIFQQDNAGGHRARFTLNIMQQHGFQPIYWPSNSPDLNPIETLWDEIKDYIQDNYPDIHRNYKRLQATITEAWEAISDNTVRDIIKTMPARCQAVIDAQGGETMY
jgi:transposase